MLEHIKENDDTAHMMVIVQDKYITINSERAEELRETYGEKIVEEKTTFADGAGLFEAPKKSRGEVPFRHRGSAAGRWQSV